MPLTGRTLMTDDGHSSHRGRGVRAAGAEGSPALDSLSP